MWRDIGAKDGDVWAFIEMCCALRRDVLRLRVNGDRRGCDDASLLWATGVPNNPMGCAHDEPCCDGGYGVARARRRRAKQGVALCTGGAAARWYVVIVGCVPAPRRAMLRQGLRGCAHRFGLRHPWHVCKWYARPHRVEPGCDKGLRGCAHRSRLRHR